MKKFLLLLAFTVLSASLFAQSEKDKKAYDDEVVTLQKQIWEDPIPEFKSTNVPANLGKESAVILARSFSLSRASTGKFKFGHHSLTTRTTKFSVFHERVKINDKTALESFSSLEYQKILNKTTSELFAKFMDVNNTFVGAKVIKANGKEIVVNTSEEVLTKDESKDKQGKLAIPDLQVGDILDYYIAREYVADKEEGNSYKDNDNIVYLVDEYPVIYFSIDFKFNKKIKIKTIYANGAKHFDQSTNEDGDQLLCLKLNNIPKFKDQLWTSALRQYPYIEIGSSYDDAVEKAIEQNHFDKNPMFQVKKLNFENEFNETRFQFAVGEQVNNLKDYYKTSKILKATPPDSIAKTLYALWKFNTFCHYIGSDISNTADLKYRRANSKLNTVNMAMTLNELKVDYDVILVASRYSNSLENVFNYEDFDAMVRVNG
ncbi:MAG TPA: hypothetical protein VHS53_03770, partial [Mucilaginibacter sp.]|nr:hypothetical protein [Mucilaginibacter sp.]